jgi:hypothetical protein
MLLIGILVGLSQAGGWFATPVDALAYWQAGASGHLYPNLWSEVGTGYLFYPPPVAQVSALLQPIGWPAFVVLLTSVNFAAFWYCAGRWSLPLVAIGIPYLAGGIGPGIPSIFLGYALLGNLQWVLAAIAIVAIRHPGLWALEALTKVTTAVGWWWHLLRGEWRAAAAGVITTGAIVGVSFALAPEMWFEFVAFVVRNYTMSDPPMPTFPVPIGMRLASAVPLLVWGARTNRSWTVPVAVGWSLPALYGFGFLPFCVAALRVRATDDRTIEPLLRGILTIRMRACRHPVSGRSLRSLLPYSHR